MCLNKIPREHRFISYRKMENEASLNFSALLDQISSTHISSLNLLTGISCICNIARLRPQFMQPVIGNFFFIFQENESIFCLIVFLQISVLN